MSYETDTEFEQEFLADTDEQEFADALTEVEAEETQAEETDTPRTVYGVDKISGPLPKSVRVARQDQAPSPLSAAIQTVIDSPELHASPDDDPRDGYVRIARYTTPIGATSAANRLRNGQTKSPAIPEGALIDFRGVRLDDGSGGVYSMLAVKYTPPVV